MMCEQSISSSRLPQVLSQQLKSRKICSVFTGCRSPRSTYHTFSSSTRLHNSPRSPPSLLYPGPATQFHSRALLGCSGLRGFWSPSYLPRCARLRLMYASTAHNHKTPFHTHNLFLGFRLKKRQQPSAFPNSATSFLNIRDLMKNHLPFPPHPVPRTRPNLLRRPSRPIVRIHVQPIVYNGDVMRDTYDRYVCQFR